MKNEERKKYPAAVMLLFALLIFLVVPVRAAQQNPVEVQLACGFAGNIKSGSSVPLTVTMTNHGSDFSGMITIRVPVRGESQALGDTLWMGNGQYGQTIGNRIYTYEKEISMEAGKTQEEVFYLEIPAFKSYLYVTVTDGSRALGGSSITLNPSENQQRLLVGVISADQEKLEELDGLQVMLEGDYPQESFVRAISLEPEDIYPNPQALGHLDILIADEDTSFTPDQQLALDAWQQEGGYFLKNDGRSYVEMARELIYEEHQEEFYQKLNNAGTYTFGETGLLGSVPVKKSPSMIKFLIFLLIYVFLAGPGIYLILKRRNRRRYLWLAICCLSVVFVVLMGILGRKTSVRAPVITCSGTYIQRGDLWQEKLDLGIQAPYNNEYQLYLNSSYRLLPWEIGTDGARYTGSTSGEQISIRTGGEKNKVTISHVPSFRQVFFTLQKDQRKEEGAGITARLSGTDQLVSGEIFNGTPYTIDCAVLLMKNRLAVAGTIGAGETVYPEKVPLESCSPIALEDFVKEHFDFSGYPFPDYQAEYFVQMLTDAMYALEDQEMILFGIVENPDLSFQENSGYKIYGTVTANIRIPMDWTNGGRVYCPNLEVYGNAEEDSYYDMDNTMFEQETTVDYPAGDVQSVSFSAGGQKEGQYYCPFDGTVAFYSWNDQAYVEVENWQRTFSETELAPYLSPDGILRVQYKMSAQNMDGRDGKTRVLPFISAVRKADG